MKLKALTLLAVLSVLPAQADPVFRIEIGKDYEKYSNAELQRRVWQLERAVFQLQQKVFELQANGAPAQESWVCTVEAMGTPYTATAPTKAAAKSKAIENCKSARQSGFHCRDPKCEQ